MPEIVVFDPTVAAPQDGSTPSGSLAPRKRDLTGLTIGFLWNTKGNADIYLDEIAKLLNQRHAGIRRVMVEKNSASMPMDPAMLAALVDCDAVVNAFGD